MLLLSCIVSQYVKGCQYAQGAVSEAWSKLLPHLVKWHAVVSDTLTYLNNTFGCWIITNTQ